MKALSFSLSLILVGGSQASDQNWRSFTNTDNVRQIAVTDDRVWAATSGGVVALTPSTGAILKLTNTDGLGGIDFNCVDLDTAGNVWLGTVDGWLTAYGPSGEITNFSVKDSSGFFARSVIIYDLFDDSERIWMANDLGISKFMKYSNGGEIKDTARRLGNLPTEEDVLSVAVIGDNLWAGTARGVAFIDKDNQNIQYFGFWRSFEQGEDGLGNAFVKSISAYFDTVIVGTQDGVFKLSVSPDTLWQSIGLAGRTVNRLAMRDSTLLAATDNGLFGYDGISWTSVPSTGLPQSNISDLSIDPVGRLWVGTLSSGLAGFSDTSWTTYSIPGPASNLIRNLAIDSSGDIWMTHNAAGLSRLSGSDWTLFNRNNSGFDDNGQFSITVGSDGRIWSGSFGGGMYMYDHNSWYHWTVSNSPMYGVPTNISYWAATAVQMDDGGNVWVSSLSADSGLIMGVFDPADSIWHLYNTGPNSVPNNTVEVLLVQGNTMWAGMADGFYKLDFSGTPFDESDDVWQTIGGEFMVALELDRRGNLWYGALEGLFLVSASGGAARQIDLPPGLSGRVNAIAADGIGNIWVGTVNGLGMLRPDFENNRMEWRALYTTENSPLLNNEVTALEIDIISGLVYIGTLNGLSIFDSGFEAPSADLSDIEAYPDPLIIDSGQSSIFFKRIPTDAHVHIYTVSGDLVAEFQGDRWDLRNGKGEKIAAGVYIFLVESEGITGTGKFAVIK